MKFADLTAPQQKLAVTLAGYPDVVEAKGIVSRARVLEIYEETKNTENKFGYPLWLQKPEFRHSRGFYRIPLPTERMIENFKAVKAKKESVANEPVVPKKRGRPAGSKNIAKVENPVVQSVEPVVVAAPVQSMFTMADMQTMIKTVVGEVITQAVPVIVREVMQNVNVQPVQQNEVEDENDEFEVDFENDVDYNDDYETDDDVSLDDILKEAGIR